MDRLIRLALKDPDRAVRALQKNSKRRAGPHILFSLREAAQVLSDNLLSFGYADAAEKVLRKFPKASTNQKKPLRRMFYEPTQGPIAGKQGIPLRP